MKLPQQHRYSVASWIQNLGSGRFFAFGWSELLGVECEPETLDDWLRFIHADDQEAVRHAVAIRSESETADSKTADSSDGDADLADSSFQLEVRSVFDDMSRLLIQGQRIKDGGDRLVVTSQNVSVLHALCTDLSSHAEESRNVADAAPMLIWTTDQQGRCNWFNQCWLEFTGSTLSAALVRGRLESLHVEDREHAAPAFDAAFAQRDPIQVEYRLLRADGEYRWMLDRSAPRFNSAGEFAGYVGICVDISYQVDLRQRIHEREQVMRQLHDISERERSFLSCSIHDGLLQDMIGVHMLLNGCENMEPAQLSKRLQSAREAMSSAIGHGRRLISELRPMIMEDQGIASAIKFYVAELDVRQRVRVQFENRLQREITSPFWGSNLFRIVQEALNNAESHSQAQLISVTVSEGNGEIRIDVVDDGVGFDPLAHQGSFGLRCMQERAVLFGGSVQITSSANGGGTAVNVVLPLPVLSS